MAIPRQYLSHAPITEALIDFRVVRSEKISPAVFDKLSERLAHDYPEHGPMQSVETMFGFQGGRVVAPEPREATIGLMLRNPVAQSVAQFRVDGFTFNKLEPYTQWQLVFNEAMRLWREYVAIARPIQISRVAVRYINRLRLSTPIANLGEYLTAPPTVPEPAPQSLKEFFTRIVVQAEREELSAIITQALEPTVDPTEVVVLLDIDAFSGIPLQADDPLIPEVFQLLRELKNRIFYASLTEELIRRYE
jgi:uncharacterized protein (TIGR04255 family)